MGDGWRGVVGTRGGGKGTVEDAMELERGNHGNDKGGRKAPQNGRGEGEGELEEDRG